MRMSLITPTQRYQRARRPNLTKAVAKTRLNLKVISPRMRISGKEARVTS